MQMATWHGEKINAYHLAKLLQNRREVSKPAHIGTLACEKNEYGKQFDW